MGLMRRVGELCAEEDEQAARSLYTDGVIPDARDSCAEISIEADGTYFRVQHATQGAPAQIEVKAMVAYASKGLEGGKVRRRGAVHHALVGKPDELWS